jgi:hypothetical protein
VEVASFEGRWEIVQALLGFLEGIDYIEDLAHILFLCDDSWWIEGFRYL